MTGENRAFAGRWWRVGTRLARKHAVLGLGRGSSAATEDRHQEEIIRLVKLEVFVGELGVLKFKRVARVSLYTSVDDVIPSTMTECNTRWSPLAVSKLEKFVLQRKSPRYQLSSFIFTIDV